MHVAWQLPGAFPDFNWLIRWLQSDVMILDDIGCFNRKSRVHRGKIRTPDGQQWIYMPIHPEDKKIPLHLARTDQTADWVTPLLRILEYNYRNSVYFDHYEPEIRDDFNKAAMFPNYLDAVFFLNSRLWKYLEIEKTPGIVMLSEVELSHGLPAILHSDSSREVAIYPEKSSSNYLKIPLNYGKIITDNLVKAPTYRQHFGEFMQGCCLYDVLFEVGPEFWRLQENFDG